MQNHPTNKTKVDVKWESKNNHVPRREHLNQTFYKISYEHSVELFTFKITKSIRNTCYIDMSVIRYLGRKRLQEKDEALMAGATMLVKPNYSYWTLGYLLSQRGARKLLAANPLGNLLPVDEYIPILYDRHTE